MLLPISVGGKRDAGGVPRNYLFEDTQVTQTDWTAIPSIPKVSEQWVQCIQSNKHQFVTLWHRMGVLTHSGSCLLLSPGSGIGKEKTGNGLVHPPEVPEVIQLLPKAMCSHAKFIHILSLWVEWFMWAAVLVKLCWVPILSASCASLFCGN